MIIRWALAARRDRAQIFDYIASYNPSAAIRMDELIAAAIAQLRDFPLLGRPGAIPGTREIIPHESYRIVYEVDEATVSILTIVHTARTWPPTRD
ncbi:type II toxin-antitoxin system RelE/ParE family toxin [Pseudorhizobium endolithicum]|uniref:Type II toxin-antitoxin system RelE/ParE family toxin n=1 Tax=Pseudorhizobium endolithicum TaxID=1191678 RepID=A0ABM8PXD3_9HYPH|nr:type II toxin-antitoxin system RelE/ParE family toxin [Pseudorhizobium endolithicum]CAD7053338.1 type II toxin-antitoxin system RelE/ParE family toxin [Pseudorhizobium endolithicum]